MKALLADLSRTSLRSRLVALVLVPLLGLIAVGFDHGRDSLEVAAVAGDLRTDAEVTAELIAISSDLSQAYDMSWAMAKASEMNVPPVVVATVLGIDLEHWLEETGAEVQHAFEQLQELAASHPAWDEYMSSEDLRETAEELALTVENVALGTNDPDAIEVSRVQSTAVLTVVMELQLKKLWVTPGSSEQSTEFVALTRSSESAYHLLLSMWNSTLVMSNYLMGLESDTISSDLYAADVEFGFALDSLEQNLAEALKDDYLQMVSSQSWLDYKDLRAELTASDFETDNFVDESGLIGGSVGSLGMIRSLYSIENGRMQELDDFQYEASAEMVDWARALESDANTSLQRTVIALLVVLLAISGGVLLTARSILLPVRAITYKATELKAGRAVPAAANGSFPRDLQLVDSALDDLTSSLQAVANQANLLALGNLEDPELDQVLEGILGASIHQSVQKLRSLTNRLDYQANHDALTGLPNRAALLRHLDQNLTGSIEQRVESTVILIDLDGFKQANDSLGHVIGDEVLCRVADRLRAFDDSVHVGRLGGDEFMIIVDAALGESAISDLTAGLLRKLTDPVSSTAGVVWLSACFGIVRSFKGTWLSPSEVLQRVDVALYEGKAQGPGSVVVFDQRLHDEILDQALLQSRLRRALAEEELSLHYQPVLGVDGTVGLEALMRWHPADELPIPPDVFIAAAEQTDLILRIDDWVLEEACRQLAEWSTSSVMASVRMSINISGRHVSNNLLPEKLEEVLRRYDIEPSLLLLEVTETELIPSIKQSVGVLGRIRELGVKLAIDDFGTGFASVAHLRRVRFDRIKIDRAFVSALDDPVERSIANLLVSLGVDLNLEVVAEGVETLEQVAWAKQAGCTHLQGYFFAKATPSHLVPNLVEELRESAPAVLCSLDKARTGSTVVTIASRSAG